jgi:hypothetical protein
MTEKIKYTSYLAGSIEANPKDASAWRNIVKGLLQTKDVSFYDPVERESQKTGKPSGEQVKYISGLKQSGNYSRFVEEMDKIWYGTIRPDGDILDTFKFLRCRKLIDGNEPRDLDYFADWEAVIRSDFLVAYISKNVPTVGTLGEILVAYLFRIPVYLILSDQTKTECNSTLLHWVLGSGGETFYTVSDCCNAIKQKYNLK